MPKSLSPPTRPNSRLQPFIKVICKNSVQAFARIIFVMTSALSGYGRAPGTAYKFILKCRRAVCAAAFSAYPALCRAGRFRCGRMCSGNMADPHTCTYHWFFFCGRSAKNIFTLFCLCGFFRLLCLTCGRVPIYNKSIYLRQSIRAQPRLLRPREMYRS